MCIICIDLAKQTMTPREARRALAEMREELDTAHLEELEQEIEKADQQTPPKE